MLLHRGADVRSSLDICDVTFQGRVVRVHEEETPHHHEAVAAAQTAQHTSRADSMSTVFSVLMSDTVMVPPCTSPFHCHGDYPASDDVPHRCLDDCVCRRRHSAPSFAGGTRGRRRWRRCATVVIVIVAVVVVIRRHGSGDGVTKRRHGGGGVGLGGSGCHHRRGG